MTIEELTVELVKLEKKVEQWEAVAELCADDVGFISRSEPFVYYEGQENDPPELFIFCSDYFHPACADAEPFPYWEAPRLLELYREKGQNAMYEVIAEKRGIPNVYWKTGKPGWPEKEK